MLDFHIHLPFHTGVFAGLNQINCFFKFKERNSLCKYNSTTSEHTRVNCISNRALLKKHRVSSMVTKCYSINSFESQFHIHPTT